MCACVSVITPATCTSSGIDWHVMYAGLPDCHLSGGGACKLSSDGSEAEGDGAWVSVLGLLAGARASELLVGEAVALALALPLPLLPEYATSHASKMNV